jgi:hypothetical protein
MEGSGLVAITDRAQENMNYVRTQLKTNQPEFAALLERLERDLSCPRCTGLVVPQMLGHISGHGRGCVVTEGACPASGTAVITASVHG